VAGISTDSQAIFTRFKKDKLSFASSQAFRVVMFQIEVFWVEIPTRP
jgi:hypothetical protein